jgi:hypothetical protein
MPGLSTGENFRNWAALLISILAGIIAGTALYYGQIRGARLVTSTGNYVYVQGRPRIGIPVTFFNDGARAGVINSGNLTLNDGSNTFQFDLKLVAASAEKWIDEGGKIKPVAAPLSLFSPVAIKAGDAAERVFWYSPRLADFRFRADTNYSANLTFSRYGAEEDEADTYSPLTAVELGRARVVFHIDNLTASNASQNPEIPIPVPTGLPAHP